MIEFLLNLIPGVDESEDEGDDRVILKRALQVAIPVIVLAVIVVSFLSMG